MPAAGTEGSPCRCSAGIISNLKHTTEETPHNYHSRAGVEHSEELVILSSNHIGQSPLLELPCKLPVQRTKHFDSPSAFSQAPGGHIFETKKLTKKSMNVHGPVVEKLKMGEEK